MKWEYKTEKESPTHYFLWLLALGEHGRNRCGEHRDKENLGAGEQEGTTGRANLGTFASYTNTRYYVNF